MKRKTKSVKMGWEFTEDGSARTADFLYPSPWVEYYIDFWKLYLGIPITADIRRCFELNPKFLVRL